MRDTPTCPRCSGPDVMPMEAQSPVEMVCPRCGWLQVAAVFVVASGHEVVGIYTTREAAERHRSGEQSIWEHPLL